MSERGGREKEGEEEGGPSDLRVGSVWGDIAKRERLLWPECVPPNSYVES